MSTKYTRTRTIGPGGMAIVYEGIDNELQRVVAIKGLATNLAADPKFTSLFLAEARKMAKVSHPNVLTIYDTEGIDETHEVPWLIMELADGGTLASLVDDAPLSSSQVESILFQSAAGLEAIHKADIVHRDLKPDNILICKGVYKIADFGIAKGAGDPTMPYATHRYVAPETLAPPYSVTPAVDVYALGLVAYELLVGREALDATIEKALADSGAGISSQEERSAVAKVLAVPTPAVLGAWLRWHLLSTDLPPPNVIQPTVPSDLSTLVHRMVTKDPVRRPGSGAEVVAAFNEMCRHRDTVNMQRPEWATAPLPEKPESGSNKSGSRLLKVGAAISAVVTALLIGLLLMPTGVKVKLVSEPSGAEVMDGTESLGKTPLERRLAAGKRLTLRLDGFADSAIEIERGKPQIAVVLTALPRVVQLHSRPSGAEVFRAGELLGRTPLEKLELVPGDEIVVRHLGYDDAEMKFGGGEENLDVALQPSSPGSALAAQLGDGLPPGLEIVVEGALRQPSGSQLPLHRPLVFRVASPHAGELHLIYVSSDGTVIGLSGEGMPLEAGVTEIGREFGLETQPPLGLDWIVGWVTPGAANPPDVSGGQQLAPGVEAYSWPGPAEAMVDALSAARTAQPILCGAVVTLEVVP